MEILYIYKMLYYSVSSQDYVDEFLIAWNLLWFIGKSGVLIFANGHGGSIYTTDIRSWQTL